MRLSRRTFLHLAAGAAALPAVLAHRKGAGLSVPAGAHHRRLCRRRRLRHRRAADRRNGCRSAWASSSWSRTARAPAATSRPRRWCARAPDGYTLLLVGPPNAINATLYQNLSFNFLRDIVPVASINREPNVVEVTSVAAGAFDPGVHRLCQGQSGQDQPCLGRHRHRRPHRRRDVQDDDRHRHGARALSRRRARRHRSHRRRRCR